MRRYLGGLSAIAATTMLLSACSGSSDSKPDAKDFAVDGTFTMSIIDDLGTFDPYRESSTFGTYRLAYDSLVNQTADGKVVSGLAEKWSADANQAEFTLKDGITCSDGTPLTASHVAKALKFLGDPANEAVQYGITAPTTPYKVEGDDATRKITVKMDEPYGFILTSIGLAPIMCDKGISNPKLLSKASDGTGPFVLTSVDPGQSYTFKVRDGYNWGPDGASTNQPGTPKTLVLKVVKNETTAANLLLAGDLNFAEVSGPDQTRVAARGLKKQLAPQSGEWLWFNHAEGRPGADDATRKALVQSLNMSDLIKANTGGKNGGPATELTDLDPNPCPAGDVYKQLPKQDVDAAKATLEKEGWVAGADGIREKGGKKLTLDIHYVPSSSTFVEPTAQLLQEQWKAVGVGVKLSADSLTSIGTVLYETFDYDIYLAGGGFNVPAQAVTYFSGPDVQNGGSNFTNIQNAKYDQLSKEAAGLTPPDACKFWDEAEDAIVAEADIAPISDRPKVYFLQKSLATVSGFSIPEPTSIRVLK